MTEPRYGDEPVRKMEQERNDTAFAQLKRREMDIYPEREFWLGGVFVSPDTRGQGIGSALCGQIADTSWMRTSICCVARSEP